MDREPLVFSRFALVARRTEAGLDVAGLATRIGKRVGTIRSYERGDRVPPTAVLGELAAALGCGVGGLFLPPDVHDRLAAAEARAAGLAAGLVVAV